MKITSQREFDNHIKNGVFICTDLMLEITCDIVTTADIKAGDINACNIKAHNINAYDINADDIKAYDINACNINAHDIEYYAVCFAYFNITCASIVGGRENAKHFCLDGEITIKSKTHTIKIDGKEIELSEESYNNLRNSLK